MNPHTTGSEPLLTHWLRRLFLTQKKQARRDRRRNDHEKRGDAAKRKHCRQIAANSRRRNRH